MTVREMVDDAVVDLLLELVDHGLFVQHGARELFVGIEHGVNRLVHRALGEAAHPEQSLFQLF